MRDESGLLLLMDSETVTDLMDASAYPGLGISWGMGYGASVSGDCNQQASQLALEGDGSSSLYSGDTDGLSIGDRAFHARAFSVYRDPDDPTCPKRRAFAVYQ